MKLKKYPFSLGEQIWGSSATQPCGITHVSVLVCRQASFVTICRPEDPFTPQLSYNEKVVFTGEPIAGLSISPTPPTCQTFGEFDPCLPGIPLGPGRVIHYIHM